MEDLDRRSFALDRLRHDIQEFGVDIDPPGWSQFAGHASAIDISAGERIQSQARISEIWVFLASGIAASEQTWHDGTSTITRFFTPGDLCANFTSVWQKEIAADDLIAMTDIKGLALPDHIFRREYLHGDALGLYFRMKAMKTHLLDKELLCAKTSNRIELRYRFLEEYQAEVLGAVMQKDIARFLGVTPQGFSRYLKQKKSLVS
ncbi:MAG: hypothetical protein AAF198_11140 [Pseudomonadota bacterium]